MENSIYTKEYLSSSGPKWTFSFDFKEKNGTLLEHETKSSFPFKFHYNKLNLTSKEGKERIENLSEIEKKWIDNCVSEVNFLKKEPNQ